MHPVTRVLLSATTINSFPQCAVHGAEAWPASKASGRHDACCMLIGILKRHVSYAKAGKAGKRCALFVHQRYDAAVGRSTDAGTDHEISQASNKVARQLRST